MNQLGGEVSRWSRQKFDQIWKQEPSSTLGTPKVPRTWWNDSTDGSLGFNMSVLFHFICLNWTPTEKGVVNSCFCHCSTTLLQQALGDSTRLELSYYSQHWGAGDHEGVPSGPWGSSPIPPAAGGLPNAGRGSGATLLFRLWVWCRQQHDILHHRWCSSDG